MEIWLGSPAASYSIRAHHSLHTLEGVALGDLVRLPRSQLFNSCAQLPPHMEGVALGDFNYGTRRFPQSLVIAIDSA